MPTLHVLLLVLAVILLALETIGIPGHPRFRLGWAGLTAFALAALL